MPRAARSFRTASHMSCGTMRSEGSSRTSHSVFGLGLFLYFFVSGSFLHSDMFQNTLPMYRSLLRKCSMVPCLQEVPRGAGMRSRLNVSAMPMLPMPSRNIWKMRRTTAASLSRMTIRRLGCSGACGVGSGTEVYPKHRPPVEKPASATPSIPRMTFFRRSRTYIESMRPRTPQNISALSSSDRTLLATSWTVTPAALNSRKTSV